MARPRTAPCPSAACWKRHQRHGERCTDECHAAYLAEQQRHYYRKRAEAEPLDDWNFLAKAAERLAKRDGTTTEDALFRFGALERRPNYKDPQRTHNPAAAKRLAKWLLGDDPEPYWCCRIERAVACEIYSRHGADTAKRDVEQWAIEKSRLGWTVALLSEEGTPVEATIDPRHNKWTVSTRLDRTQVPVAVGTMRSDWIEAAIAIAEHWLSTSCDHADLNERQYAATCRRCEATVVTSHWKTTRPDTSESTP